MTKEILICEPHEIPEIANGNVEVEIVGSGPDANGEVIWSHEVKSPGHDNGGKIKLGKDLGYLIRFDLRDDTRLHLRFDASGPFFVKEGTADPCPSTLGSTQCMVDDCDAKKLTVIDWNFGDPLQLRYQLNFVTRTGKRVNPYDPIIENGGGGVPPFIEF